MSNLVAVLRRAQLDEKDRLILRVVWDNWRRGIGTTFRELIMEGHPYADGLSLTGVRYRIGLKANQQPPRLAGLLQTGWLAVADGQLYRVPRSLRPGPRFAGMDHDWPLEVIECKEVSIPADEMVPVLR